MHYVTSRKEFLLWLTSSSNLTSKNLPSTKNLNLFHLAPALLPPSAQGQHRTAQLATSLKTNVLPCRSCHSIKLLLHLSQTTRFISSLRKEMYSHLTLTLACCLSKGSWTSPNKLLLLDGEQAYHFPVCSHLLTFFRSNHFPLYLRRGKIDKNAMWLIHFLPLAVPVNLSISYTTNCPEQQWSHLYQTWMSINSLKLNSSLCLEWSLLLAKMHSENQVVSCFNYFRICQTHCQRHWVCRLHASNSYATGWLSLGKRRG